MGADQRAIYLDAHALEFDLVPLDLKDNVVVIMNTNKRRELADSKYNSAVLSVKKLWKIAKLPDSPDLGGGWVGSDQPATIKEWKSAKRARHAVLENQHCP